MICAVRVIENRPNPFKVLGTVNINGKNDKDKRTMMGHLRPKWD